jgi:O-acetyl-ADP-ribose deacetylase (regulator of RNase III)
MAACSSSTGLAGVPLSSSLTVIDQQVREHKACDSQSCPATDRMRTVITACAHLVAQANAFRTAVTPSSRDAPFAAFGLIASVSP